MEPIWITGMGFITSIGNDRSTVVQNLRDLRHGIENPDFLAVDSSPVKVAGTLKDFEVDSADPEDWLYPSEFQVPRATIRSFSPHVLYAWCAVQQAILDASLSEDEVKDPKSGLYTSSGGSMSPFTSISENGSTGSYGMQSIGDRSLDCRHAYLQSCCHPWNSRVFNWYRFCLCIIWSCTWNGNG